MTTTPLVALRYCELTHAQADVVDHLKSELVPIHLSRHVKSKLKISREKLEREIKRACRRIFSIKG